MKKFITLSLIIFSLILSACQFNQSVHKDLTTGAYSRGDGIGCDDVVIKIAGKSEKRTEFLFGEKVNLVFNNIRGLTNSDNKTYPGLSMFIVKNDKDTVLSNPNLLEGLADGTDLSPLQLNANFIAALPYQDNEKYKVYIQIWDKKGTGKFTYELPFTVKESELLSINNKGIDYSSIYLWDETLKQPVYENQLNPDHLFILILEGIEGLELSDDKVFPIFSIDLIDNNGNKIISNPNLLSDYENEGVSPDDLKKQFTAKITFSEGEIYNPCKLITQIKDMKSSKEIIITSELIIE